MPTKAKRPAVCAGRWRGRALVLVLMAERIAGSELVGGNRLSGLPITECDFYVEAKRVTVRNDVRIYAVVFSRQKFMEGLSRQAHNVCKLLLLHVLVQ